MSSIARSATRRIVGPIVEPLFRRSPAQPAPDSDNEPLVKPRPTRKKKPPPDSDHDPTAASSNQPQAIPARPRRPRINGKQNEQGVLYNRGSSDSDNRPLVKARPAPVPDPRRRIRGKQENDRSKLYREVQGSGQQAPLVNYGTGVRQMRKGGGKTIRAMAPILDSTRQPMTPT